MEDFISVGGSVFTIDLDMFTKTLLVDKEVANKGIETEIKKKIDKDGNVFLTTEISREYDKGPEIDGAKYDTIRLCLEILLTFNEDLDDSLGFELAMSKTPINFKLAFNTLLSYGIIKEIA